MDQKILAKNRSTQILKAFEFCSRQSKFTPSQRPSASTSLDWGKPSLNPAVTVTAPDNRRGPVGG